MPTTAGSRIIKINIKLAIQVVLLIVALVGATYTRYLKYESSNSPTICNYNQTFNCSNVSESEYAEFFGIPIAFFGVLLVLFNFDVLAIKHLKVFEKLRTKFPDYFTIALVVNTIGALASVLLLFLQFFVIKSICLFCLVFDTSMIIFTILLYTEFLKQPETKN